MVEWRISKGHLRAYRKEAGLNCNQILGFLCIDAYTLCRGNTKFYVEHMGRGPCIDDQPRPDGPPKEGGVPALPNFRDSFVFVRSLFVAELPNLTW